MEVWLDGWFHIAVMVLIIYVVIAPVIMINLLHEILRLLKKKGH